MVEDESGNRRLSPEEIRVLRAERAQRHRQTRGRLRQAEQSLSGGDYQDRAALEAEIARLRQEEEQLRRQRQQEAQQFRQDRQSWQQQSQNPEHWDKEVDVARQELEQHRQEVGIERRREARERIRDSSKSGLLWAILAVAIMVMDLVGEPFVGYRLPTTISDLWTLLPVLTSVFFLGMVFMRFVMGLVEDRFHLGMLVIYLAIFHYLGNSAIPFELVQGSVVSLILGAILIILFFRDKNRGRTFFTIDDVIFLLYAFILSLLLLNVFNWFVQGDFKAFAHLIFILAFGYAFIKPNEQDESKFHIWMAVLLFFDFFGSGFYQQANLFQYIPFLSVIAIWYVAKQTRNWLAITLLLVIAGFSFFINITDASIEDVLGTVNLEREEAQLSAEERAESIWDKLAFWTSSRIEEATQFRGNVEENQYESLGVYFSNLRAAQPRFYTDEPITIWGSIRSKTYQDAVLVDFKCYVWKDGRRHPVADVVPSQTFPVFELEETDVECTIPQASSRSALDAGIHMVTFSAEYNFDTNAYQKVYLMDQTRYRALIREDIDPFKQYGIRDTQPKTVFTNGPVEIGMDIEPLITVSAGRIVSPTLFLTLSNREQIKDPDSDLITRWDGKIKQITELVLLLPPGVDLLPYSEEEKEELRQAGVDTARVDLEEYRKCSPLPFKRYTPEQCSLSCKSSVTACEETCEGIEACEEGCAQSGGSCQEDCDFLFNGNQDTVGDGAYNAYALDTSLIEARRENLDEFRDIDRFKTFACRLLTSPEALDNTPITTSYLRVRAEYDYLLENSVQVKVEEPPIAFTPVSATDEVANFSKLPSVSGFSNTELLTAVAFAESGLKHCCQQGYGGAGSTCIRADPRSCGPASSERVITSGSSYGIMQVNPPVHRERIQDICGAYEQIYDYTCNINVGIDILESYYNQYKDGISRSLVERFCADPQLIEKYVSYRGWNAALRAYNGLGCGKNADINYVEKINEALAKVRAGTITYDDFDALGRSGESTQDTSGLEETSPQPSPPEALTLGYENGAVEIRFGPSPSVDSGDYRVNRREQGSQQRTLICQPDHTGAAFYSCQDSDVELTRTYIYEVTAYKDTEQGQAFSVPAQESILITN